MTGKEVKDYYMIECMFDEETKKLDVGGQDVPMDDVSLGHWEVYFLTNVAEFNVGVGHGTKLKVSASDVDLDGSLRADASDTAKEVMMWARQNLMETVELRFLFLYSDHLTAGARDVTRSY